MTTMSRMRRFFARLEPGPLRRSIGARVLTGFFLTAALAVAVASVSLAYNQDAGRNLARVTERDRELSSALRELEVAVEQQSGAVQNFLLSGDDRDLDTLAAGRARFSDALARLAQEQTDSDSVARLAEVRAQAQSLDEIAAEEIALYRQGWGRSANFLWREDGLATKQRLLGSVKALAQLQNAQVDEEIAASRGHLRYSFGLSLALVALAAVLAFGIGMAITRAVTGPVRNLVRMATVVSSGDYSVRAPVEGEDELATLSATMNAMVDSLTASRSQLEQALAETARSEERYRLLAVNANDLIFTLDRETRITFINPAVEKTLGYTPDELLGKRANMLFTSRTQTTLTDRGTWVETAPSSFKTDIELAAKDGRAVPLEVSMTIMQREDSPVRVQGIARDMTERFRMEEELRRLHTQDRRRVHQLITVNEMGRKIAALQPLDQLLPHLVRMLGTTFEYEHVRILLQTDEQGDDGDLAIAAAWHKDEDAVGRDGALISPLVERALQGDAGFVAGSGRPEDDASTRYTEVAVPVRTKTEVLGVLDIRGGVDAALDESDIFTLQTLADQIAVAIENARLYETGQQLAVSEERNRLARELHDSVTQELFSMTMIAGALPALMERNPAVAKERVDRLHELSRGALAEMRALLFALRPAALAEEGLVSALSKHAAAFESREGIRVHLEVDGEGRLPQPCEEALYRIFGEALNNVVKHAKARNVWVQLAIGDDESALLVRDDGIGFDITPQTGVHTMGLTSMRERVAALKGDFRVESAPGQGTSIRVTVPVGVEQCVTAEAGV
jgi:PAS domain S-box-containing protein